MRRPFYCFLLLTGILVASNFLGGCGLYSSTSYQPNTHSWLNSYGFDDAPIDTNIYSVTFSGNAMTRPDVVDRYALYRSAELTIEKGYDYFTVLHAQHNTQTFSSTTMNNSTSIEHDMDPVTGKMVPVAVTTSTPMTSTGTAHTITKTIRMYHGARPDSLTTAFDARSMVKVMAPGIDRGQ